MSAPELSVEARKALLRLARQALVDHYAGQATTIPEGPPVLRVRAGAFVTLRGRDGGLRGCVGTMEPGDALGEAVARLAVVAATSDDRFPAVTASEVEGLVLEISALGPLRDVEPEGVLVGCHGLMVRAAGRQGVLLPQVATEQGWDRETFLEKTCQKAGLPRDAWRGAGTRIRAFEATVFGEND